MKVNNNRITDIIIKNTITDFCKDRLNKVFIKKIIIFLIERSILLVRLLGFEPRTSWSVAKRSIQLSYRRIFNLFFIIQKNIEEK